MNNTNIEMGKPAKGRVIFCGGMAHATLVISASDWDMPTCHVPHQPSWTELNRGRKSKKQRRK